MGKASQNSYGWRNRSLHWMVSAALVPASGVLYTTAAWADPPVPTIWVNITDDTLGGENFTPDDYVNVKVYDHLDGTVIFEREGYPTDASGAIGQPDDSGAVHVDIPVDLVPGAVVTVTEGSTATVKAVTLTDLSFDTLDPATDIAAGRAPADTHVAGLVGSTNNPCTGDPVPTFPFETLAGEDGTWSAHLAVDLLGMARGIVSTADTDGDQTRASAQPRPDPSLGVSLRSEQITSATDDRGGGWNPSSSVSVTITSSEGHVLYRGVAATDDGGQFTLTYAEHGINLKPGMRVKVADSDHTANVNLIQLTWDVLDPETGTAKGTIVSDLPPCVAGIIEFSKRKAGKGLWLLNPDAAGHWTEQFNARDVTKNSTGSIGHASTVAEYIAPNQALANLLDTVKSFADQGIMTHRQAADLSRLLRRARRGVNTDSTPEAVTALNVFVQHVNRYVANGVLNAQRADKLADDAGSVITTLEG